MHILAHKHNGIFIPHTEKEYQTLVEMLDIA
jgi:hypothetical protein